jgi:hypothetical protein
MDAVIRNEHHVLRLTVDRGANDNAVPIDHLLQSSRLQIHVMEREFNHLHALFHPRMPGVSHPIYGSPPGLL